MSAFTRSEIRVGASLPGNSLFDKNRFRAPAPSFPEHAGKSGTGTVDLHQSRYQVQAFTPNLQN